LPYIHFTEEQIYRANSVDLEQFLHRQGEKLIRAGREKRLESNHSVTVRGNAWYDHSTGTGGLAIDFIQNYCGLSFPDAVVRLLGGETGVAYEPAKKEPYQEPKPFSLPPAHSDMRRVFAYLLKHRLLDRDIVSHFAKEKLIYESNERVKNKQGEWKEYHNAVFVGLDENGVVRHAHKRGLYTEGGYKGNVDSSDPAYSFHHTGTSSRLYVFEAPIDLLSFLSLYPQVWRGHSYVALCGVAEHAMLKILKLNPYLQEITLCLDHDEAGIEAAGRLTEILNEKGYNQVSLLLPGNKDWNEDIKAGRGFPAISAEEHPQLVLCGPVCGHIARTLEGISKSADPERLIPDLLQRFKEHLTWGRLERAMTCAEDMAVFSLFMAAREYRQMGRNLSPDDLSAMLRDNFHPHQNRGRIQNRATDIALSLQKALSLKHSDGVRSSEQKQKQADAWIDLALGCAKAIISVQADEFRLAQKAQELNKPSMVME
jgi:hypothetical protein